LKKLVNNPNYFILFWDHSQEKEIQGFEERTTLEEAKRVESSLKQDYPKIEVRILFNATEIVDEEE